MLQDEIQKAIGAHGLWKSRLKRAITSGAADVTVENTAVDDRCDFGRWLHALPRASQSAANFGAVKSLHAQFHVEAASVLKLALAGQKDAAAQAMAPGSKFDRLTTELTRALMEWNRAA